MTRLRIRSIKPEMFADEAFGTLNHQARLLFIGLITMADDEGRLRALPAAIIGHVFPYDDVQLRKLNLWLDELVAAGLIVVYKSSGLPYAWLPGWCKHQRINRLTPSSLPAPPNVAAASASDRPPVDGYKKAAIPEKVRRAVALREGGVPGETTPAACHYCDAPGKIVWARLASGRAGSWVQFTDLELDHVHPEFHGGEAVEENIVLACQSCNRRKGHGMSTDSSNGAHGMSTGSPPCAGAFRSGPDPDDENAEDESNDAPASAIARKVSYQGKAVSAPVIQGAERLLAVFNEAVGRTLGAWTADGKPSSSCKQIIGAMLARPDVTVEQWEAGVKRTVASPPSFVNGGPIHLGHVFGEKAAEWALTEGARNGAVAADVAEGDRLIAQALAGRNAA